VPLSSLRTAAAGAWTRHKDLLTNAASLLATTGVTSVLGFAFWAFAAREFSPQAVGYGSAAVGAMRRSAVRAPVFSSMRNKRLDCGATTTCA